MGNDNDRSCSSRHLLPRDHQHIRFWGRRHLQPRWIDAVACRSSLRFHGHSLKAKKMMFRRDWTFLEDAVLRRGALVEQTVGDVARQIDRTMSAVLKRARVLQIKLRAIPTRQ
jgi:hypothetical protein